MELMWLIEHLELMEHLKLINLDYTPKRNRAIIFTLKNAIIALDFKIHFFSTSHDVTSFCFIVVFGAICYVYVCSNEL